MSLTTSLILLTLLVAASNALCPSKCICTEDVLNCTGSSFTRIPDLKQLYPFQPTILDFSGNKIFIIESQDFDYTGSDKVKTLLLNDNRLIDVDENSFKPLTSVAEIFLARNFLESVLPMLIADNKRLFLLDLSGNMFVSDTPQLQSDSLEIIDLSECKISTFDHENLKYLPDLKIIKLRENNLKQVPPTIFVDMLYVDLKQNPWECSQSTIDLFEYLRSRNLTDPRESVKCLAKNKEYKIIYSEKGPSNLDNLETAEAEPQEENHFDLDDYMYDYDVQLDEETDFEFRNSINPNSEESDEDVSSTRVVKNSDAFPIPSFYNDDSTSIFNNSHLNLIENHTVEKKESIITTTDEISEKESLPNDFFYYNKKSFVGIGLAAFALTFLAGVVFGFGVIRRVFGREKTVNGSTARLILSDDCA